MTGEVGKPGAFVVPKTASHGDAGDRPGRGARTLRGGATDQVIRKIDGEEVVFPFNYRDYTKGDDMGGNITLRNGDVVVVPERGLFQ